jgi:hypothetical protein
MVWVCEIAVTKEARASLVSVPSRARTRTRAHRVCLISTTFYTYKISAKCSTTLYGPLISGTWYVALPLRSHW